MMTTKPKNDGRRWTTDDRTRLKDLADGNTPTRLIALKLGRSEGAIRSMASELDLSLKPTNQSPYGTSKKK